MDEYAEKLIMEGLAKNFVDHKAYFSTTDIEKRCVNMVAELFNAPVNGDRQAIGTSTVGSSEAIMLCMLALKHHWIKNRRTARKSVSRPNIIMNSTAQVCWQKAARYFDVEVKYVYCSENRFVLGPGAAVRLVDEETIAICCVLSEESFATSNATR